MWLAVIIGVCLAVEVLTYLTGGEISMNKKNEKSEAEQESPVKCQASRNLAA
jgi:anthranilate/para-aminobenzoate synthase component II